MNLGRWLRRSGQPPHSGPTKRVNVPHPQENALKKQFQKTIKELSGCERGRQIAAEPVVFYVVNAIKRGDRRSGAFGTGQLSIWYTFGPAKDGLAAA